MFNRSIFEPKVTPHGYVMLCQYTRDHLFWWVVWNIWIMFPFSWECHHPNWLSYFSEPNIFQNWLVFEPTPLVSNIYFAIQLGIITPTDYIICLYFFQRGRLNHQPVLFGWCGLVFHCSPGRCRQVATALDLRSLEQKFQDPAQDPARSSCDSEDCCFPGEKKKQET